MVKGITANNIVNTPGVSDDMFQLNLDGQQITQKIAGSGFGQPRFSREAIAEFQIVTNLFDITQGRSAGVQVQAISKSGTNTNSGSIYGFFRDDKLNARRQGGQSRAAVLESAGGRHVRRADRARQAALLRVVRVRARAGHLLQQSVDAARTDLHGAVQERPEEFPRARGRSAHDQQPSVDSRIALDLEQPVRSRRQRSSVERLGADQGRHQHPRHAGPTSGRAATRCISSGSATTTSTGPTRHSPEMEGSPQYDFPGPDDRRPLQLPAASEAEQLGRPLRPDLEQGHATISSSASSTCTCSTPATGTSRRSGATRCRACRRISGARAGGARRSIRRSGISPDSARSTLRFDQNYSYSGWENIIDSPRPTYARVVWRQLAREQHLTINYGVRWDADPNMASAPNVKEGAILDRCRACRADRLLPDRHRPTTATSAASATGATSRRAPASPTTSAAGTISSSAAAAASTTRARCRT